jgi:multisubunit Na+/H+ antiporter MnhF subunit
MRSKMLSGLVIFFALALGLVLFISDRSISRFLEECGGVISQTFGF